MATSQRPVGYRWYVATWVIAIVLIGSMVAIWIYRGLEQRQVVAQVSGLGATVNYADSPGWLRAVGRPARSGSVVGVDFTGTAVTDGDLVHLKHLWHLRNLELRGTQVSDAGLFHLTSLPMLTILYLNGTRVGNAGVGTLSSMTDLRVLSLASTHVTDEGLRHLRALSKLEWLNLDWTQVSDSGLDELQSLNSLTRLFVSNPPNASNISTDRLAAFQRDHPHCRVNQPV